MQDRPNATRSSTGNTPSETTQARGRDTRPGPSFLGRLFHRTPDALGPDETAELRDRAGLGPAFRNASPAELAMVMNVLRLRDRRVAEVMIPRADIVAIAADAMLEDLMAAYERGSLSRLPVYRETLDDPIGFVHLKDIALAHGVGATAGMSTKPFNLSDHIREALFVPPSMRIVALLQRMQAARIHMALVIDEFGGVDGLVTIEDLVEQIVGDIIDEHDPEEREMWSEEAPGIYLLKARADIHAFEESEGVRLVPPDWDEDVETFGGLVFMLSGRVPARGEIIAHPAGHEFEITDADPRRIKRLRLTLNGAGRAGTAAAAAE